MKKKVLKTIGLVLAMVSCVGLTVFAAPSVSGSSVVTGVANASGSNGSYASVIVVDPVNPDVVSDIKKESTLKDSLGDKYDENHKVVDVKDVVVEGDVQYPLTVTFNVTGVTPDTKGYVLQYVDGKWIALEAKMGNGTVTVTLNQPGTLAFVFDTTTLQAGSVSSPQTSASAAALVGLVGIAAASSAVVLKKKQR